MDTQLHAIADPTRREILRQLSAGEQSAGAIAALFDVTRPAVSHHLRVLRDAGLISVRRKAQSRIYSLDAAALDQLRARFNQFWDDALPRLKSVVEANSRASRSKRNRHG
jgi:DNA-binding transcriptional ArsR family regulator